MRNHPDLMNLQAVLLPSPNFYFLVSSLFSSFTSLFVTKTEATHSIASNESANFNVVF